MTACCRVGNINQSKSGAERANMILAGGHWTGSKIPQVYHHFLSSSIFQHYGWLKNMCAQIEKVGYAPKKINQIIIQNCEPVSFYTILYRLWGATACSLLIHVSVLESHRKSNHLILSLIYQEVQTVNWEILTDKEGKRTRQFNMLAHLEDIQRQNIFINFTY